MRKYHLLIFVLFYSISSYSQDSNLSLELSFPIPVGENIISYSYKGVVDLGVKYRQEKSDYLSLGYSFNLGYLRSAGYTAASFIMEPRVFLEARSKATGLHASIGLGYSIMAFTVLDKDFEFIGLLESGINPNLGIGYDFTRNIYAQIQYDYIHLVLKEGLADISYYKRRGFIKICLGHRLHKSELSK